MEKRIKCIVLGAVLLTVFLLAGCGGQVKKDERVKISILAKNSWYSYVDYESAEIVKRMVEDSNYDVEWKLQQPSSYYDIVRELILKGGTLADIVQIPELDTNMEYIATGKFVKLDEYMEHMPNFRAYLEANPEVKASLTTDTGHIYYVPQTVLTSNYVPCVMYNMRWLDKTGKEVPKTLDEFVELLRIYKISDMNNNGDANDEIPLSITADFIPYLFGPAFGLDLVTGFYADENGAVRYAYYENENYKKYLEFVNGLYKEGLLDVNFENTTREINKERCANNTVGVTFDYSWHMSMSYSSQYLDYNGSEPVFAGAAPLSGEYEGYYIGRNAISGLFGVTDGKNAVEAVKLLDYMISEENETSYCFGILGESYIVNEDGSKSFTDAALNDEYIQGLGINPVCVPSRQSVEATDALLPEWHSALDKELVKYVRLPFPFIYATTEESKKNKGYSDYIAKYVSQQSREFITGRQSLDEFDNYIATLENMGIEDIIKLKQNQYNRWKSFR